MDPEACFLAFCGCIRDREPELARDAADSYRDWIAKGGFPARDRDGSTVLSLDAERRIYTVQGYGGVRCVRRAASR